MRILFACVGNSCRSQMAEAFCREYGRNVECESVGTLPAERVMPETIEVMAEAGIDLSGARPRGFADLSGPGFDCIVTMGRDVDCPVLPCDKLIKWRIPDPCGRSIDEYRRTRDRIGKQVHILLGSLDLLGQNVSRDS